MHVLVTKRDSRIFSLTDMIEVRFDGNRIFSLVIYLFKFEHCYQLMRGSVFSIQRFSHQIHHYIFTLFEKLGSSPIESEFCLFFYTKSTKSNSHI